ncbi:hypothetical protein H072_7433 [Dactylellina haptotyla CBS 200.50]|uniref:Uncharacterized protein n=1 Tax=Dactylellina haptotyla (strain CBS 200.50) TaxID=1284197 RepID=S8A749_DACHA|nr:hypothetical protein H072_7433 [Dactylellina haptotyla CBS 200.50]
MDEWYDFDADFWDEYYGAEDDMNMATLANDLAESAVPDINWSVFDENPTSRDLQLFDWEDDWILFEFDHDEYYDTHSSPRQTPTKLLSLSSSATNLAAMDEDQLHHNPVPVSAKDAAAIAAAAVANPQSGSDTPMTDDTEDGLDGGLRKKRPDVHLSAAQQSALDKKSGQSSRSQSHERPSSAASRRSRTPVPNPNTGPQSGEELEVIYEDSEKKVAIVTSGGLLGKLRVIRKDTVQLPSAPANSSTTTTTATSGGPGPSPLRNAANASDAGKLDIMLNALTPK